MNGKKVLNVFDPLLRYSLVHVIGCDEDGETMDMVGIVKDVNYDKISITGMLIGQGFRDEITFYLHQFESGDMEMYTYTEPVLVQFGQKKGVVTT